MKTDMKEENSVFHTITDKQAVLTQGRISSFPKTTFPNLKAMYAQCVDTAKKENEKAVDDETRDYDGSISQLLACEYYLRKSTDKKAVEFVNLNKPRYNFVFNIVNEDIDEINRKIDDPTFDWAGLKAGVEDREAEEKNAEQADFLADLSAQTDMNPQTENGISQAQTTSIHPDFQIKK